MSNFQCNLYIFVIRLIYVGWIGKSQDFTQSMILSVDTMPWMNALKTLEKDEELHYALFATWYRTVNETYTIFYFCPTKNYNISAIIPNRPFKAVAIRNLQLSRFKQYCSK